MSVEDAAAVGLHDHQRFLRAWPPYASLDAASLAALVRDLQVVYRPAGAILDVQGGLFVIRRGRIALNGEEYGEGETIGGGVRNGQGRAAVDTWLYVLPPQAAARWLAHPAIQRHLHAALSARLDEGGTGMDLSTLQIGEIMHPVELAAPHLTVQQAAARMRERRISSLVLDLGERGFGIVTDKDLRNKVLAEGLPASTPVGQVMSTPTLTAPPDMPALSALNLMFRRNVRHLPVQQGGRMVGIVGTADLLRLQTQGVGYIVQDLLDAPDPVALAALGRKLPEYTANLYRAGQQAGHLARLQSYAYDALYRRAIELAQAEIGPAPCAFAWLLLGSIARRESGLNPDQDHHLLIADAAHRDYFQQALAPRVEAMLEEAGLERCDGGVMASNHTHTVDEHVARMRDWQDLPDPQALLNATIFFDPRAVAGDLDVRAARAARLGGGQNTGFMGHLLRLALNRAPPLTFLQRIRGDRDNRLDIKLHGLAPIIDLARIHALAVGEPNASTFVRLRADGDSPLHPDTRADLLGAYGYLMDLRMQLQRGQLARGEPLGTLLPLDGLSGPVEVHLREIFRMIGRVHADLAPRIGVR